MISLEWPTYSIYENFQKQQKSNYDSHLSAKGERKKKPKSKHRQDAGLELFSEISENKING